MLRENDIPVMVSRVHELPRYDEDDIDLPFRLPKLLEDEGVLYCLQNAGGMEHMGTRNLPFYAGTAHAYGLTYEQAVRSVTLSTAEILGVDRHYGSLETGKSATLFISDGDALDVRGNDLLNAFIDGREIDLDNRQKELYRKFQEKYNAPIVE
jgi:imidazolonepropionase-like amidohydrolase